MCYSPNGNVSWCYIAARNESLGLLKSPCNNKQCLSLKSLIVLYYCDNSVYIVLYIYE